mgnify:CR=1 FL=1
MDQVLAALHALLVSPFGALVVAAVVTGSLNFFVDRVLCAPADSSPEFGPWLEANPVRGGLVKLIRGFGTDAIKGAHGFLIAITARKPEEDPSLSMRPPPNKDGGLE